MGRLLIGRIVSALLIVGSLLLAITRAVLDVIDYSTVTEDVTIAQTRLDQFFIWLLSLPWGVPWGFALISTVSLIWVSWPRQVTAASQADDDKINPYAGDIPTFAELLLTVNEFRCKEIASSNIFDTAVSLVDGDKTKLEVLVVFDKWIVSRNAGITCNNRLDGYQTSILKITDRYLICRILNVGSPGVIRIECF